MPNNRRIFFVGGIAISASMLMVSITLLLGHSVETIMTVAGINLEKTANIALWVVVEGLFLATLFAAGLLLAYSVGHGLKYVGAQRGGAVSIDSRAAILSGLILALGGLIAFEFTITPEKLGEIQVAGLALRELILGAALFLLAGMLMLATFTMGVLITIFIYKLTALAEGGFEILRHTQFLKPKRRSP